MTSFTYFDNYSTKMLKTFKLGNDTKKKYTIINPLNANSEQNNKSKYKYSGVYRITCPNLD